MDFYKHKRGAAEPKELMALLESVASGPDDQTSTGGLKNCCCGRLPNYAVMDTLSSDSFPPHAADVPAEASLFTLQLIDAFFAVRSQELVEGTPELQQRVSRVAASEMALKLSGTVDGARYKIGDLLVSVGHIRIGPTVKGMLLLIEYGPISALLESAAGEVDFSCSRLLGEVVEDLLHDAWEITASDHDQPSTAALPGGLQQINLGAPPSFQANAR